MIVKMRTYQTKPGMRARFLDRFHRQDDAGMCGSAYRSLSRSSAWTMKMCSSLRAVSPRQIRVIR